MPLGPAPFDLSSNLRTPLGSVVGGVCCFLVFSAMGGHLPLSFTKTKLNAEAKHSERLDAEFSTHPLSFLIVLLSPHLFAINLKIGLVSPFSSLSHMKKIVFFVNK